MGVGWIHAGTFSSRHLSISARCKILPTGNYYIVVTVS